MYLEPIHNNNTSRSRSQLKVKGHRCGGACVLRPLLLQDFSWSTNKGSTICIFVSTSTSETWLTIKEIYPKVIIFETLLTSIFHYVTRHLIMFAHFFPNHPFKNHLKSIHNLIFNLNLKGVLKLKLKFKKKCIWK